MQDMGVLSGFLFNLNYMFTSFLGDEEERFLTEVEAELVCLTDDEEMRPIGVVGKMGISILHLAAALDEGFHPLQIFDLRNDLINLGGTIYDFEALDFTEELNEFFDYQLFGHDICVIDHIELTSEFRGYGLGRLMVKDMVNKFGNSFRLFVAETEPMQFYEDFEDPAWAKKVLEDLPTNDEERAMYKLYAFFQNLGFEKVYPDRNLFFYNDAMINEKLQKTGWKRE